MQKNLLGESHLRILFCLCVLGLLTAIIILPDHFQSAAQINSSGTGLFKQTVSRNPNLENYDIREVRSEDVVETLAKFRSTSGKDAVALADVRADFVRGENELRSRVPSLKVQYSNDLRVPEVITVNELSNDSLFSTGIPANRKHAEAVRNFLQSNDNLFGMNDSQINSLKVAADYTNPDGNLSYVDLAQEINGVPVFRGEVRAGITKDGRIFRMINNLAPGLDYADVSKDFGNPEDALFAAARHINRTPTAADVNKIGTELDGKLIEFDRGQFADSTTAEQIYFPIEPGVIVPAWRIFIAEEVPAYYVIVDTKGNLLWRKNLVEQQTQSATYNVYDSDSPAPSSPLTNTPGTNFQAAAVPRVNVTLIGNEPPNTFNNLGWITDNANGVNGWTDGNNGEAGLDVFTPDNVDVPVAGVNRVFNFDYNPPPGNPAPGGEPQTVNSRNGMVVNMFYWANVYHDRLYLAGFTEAARNFQNDNFGRGGLANDRLRLQGQDFASINNADMLTRVDGNRSRARMFLFFRSDTGSGQRTRPTDIHPRTDARNIQPSDRKCNGFRQQSRQKYGRRLV